MIIGLVMVLIVSEHLSPDHQEMVPGATAWVAPALSAVSPQLRWFPKGRQPGVICAHGGSSFLVRPPSRECIARNKFSSVPRSCPLWIGPEDSFPLRSGHAFPPPSDPVCKAELRQADSDCISCPSANKSIFIQHPCRARNCAYYLLLSCQPPHGLSSHLTKYPASF